MPHWTPAPWRTVTLLGLLSLACASSGSPGAGAPAPGGSSEQQGVDCEALPACDDELKCSGGAQCFKLKSCEAFVCTSIKAACSGECGSKDCMVLESQPMLLACK